MFCGIWKKHIALPQEHGSWVFILSPLLIGLFAAGRFTWVSVAIIVAAMSAFLLRQPMSILVKVYSGRRSRQDLVPARFWVTLYSLGALGGLIVLLSKGFFFVLWLALPGIPVFLWHLYLISRRAERRQMGIEMWQLVSWLWLRRPLFGWVKAPMIRRAGGSGCSVGSRPPLRSSMRLCGWSNASGRASYP